MVIWVNDRWGLEIMPPGKAYNLLTDHPITGPLRSLLWKSGLVKSSIYKPKLFTWIVILYKHLLDTC